LSVDYGIRLFDLQAFSVRVARAHTGINFYAHSTRTANRFLFLNILTHTQTRPNSMSRRGEPATSGGLCFMLTKRTSALSFSLSIISRASSNSSHPFTKTPIFLISLTTTAPRACAASAAPTPGASARARAGPTAGCFPAAGSGSAGPAPRYTRSARSGGCGPTGQFAAPIRQTPPAAATWRRRGDRRGRSRAGRC
jgi:hypothetical protein